MFEMIPPFPGDPILSLVEDFLKDPRPQKVNLSIGLLYDGEGRIPLLPSVREAENRLVAEHLPRPYLPMEGDTAYREAARDYVFGAEHEVVQANRVASVQTLGGSGALKLAADLLHRYFPQSKAWISQPTWDNHRAILTSSGVQVHEYPYYDQIANQVRFDEMLACMEHLPSHSIVILHPCCHNPTGMDLTPEQWKQLLPVFKERSLIAYLDIAYQGFGRGIAEDAWLMRTFASAGLSFFVGSSFSKSFSWYGERVGALHVVCADATESANVLGQLKSCVRHIYSSPPVHGAAVVNMVLRDPALRARWEAEVNSLRERIQAMRAMLRSVMNAKMPGHDFSYFTTQQGLFSYTGLTPEQVDRLRHEFAIYLVRSGRMCVAGLNEHNVEYVARCMAQVLAPG